MSRKWNPTLWSKTFDQMLKEKLGNDDSWEFRSNNSLEENLSDDEKSLGWKISSCRSAHGTFRCGTCRRSWPSARVTLLFHYRLRSEAARGTVIMRPFGQACRGCSGKFLLPGFSRLQVKMVLLKLIRKIKKNCYGEEQENNNNSFPSENVRTKPHESSLCEACSQGMCRVGKET
ncbi:receptor-transporting protein 4-like [Anguilla rostrata]|uniref:receptor-transporting protein 4-like n=1 Tax=Anguilla rostrata TaxID=7938 RepID=UPI0030CFA7FA